MTFFRIIFVTVLQDLDINEQVLHNSLTQILIKVDAFQVGLSEALQYGFYTAFFNSKIKHAKMLKPIEKMLGLG